MYLFKTNQFLLILLFIGTIAGQSQDEEEPKTFLFGLIKFDTSSPYEEGYWIDRWFRAREFSIPITFMPIEIRFGGGLNGKLSGSFASPSAGDMDNWIWYDSEEIEPFNQEMINIFGTSLDMDLMMINIPNYVTNTSWMNVLTGLNYRSSTLLNPKSIPYEEWGTNNETWNLNRKFSPSVTEYLITNTLQWQPFSWWYMNFRYGYGWASSTFYLNPDTEQIEPEPNGTGTSMAAALGIRFIIDPGKVNRFSIGVDLRHSYTKINNIIDPSDLTPMNRFDLANYGVYFTLSAFYGGKNTIGDEAKGIYFRKDYISAKKKFIHFLKQFPAHANRYRAEMYVKECNKKIPYQIMDEGLLFDDKGETERALGKYLTAKSKVVTNDTLIIDALDFRIDEIARKWMNQAETILGNEQYIDAYQMVKKVAQFSDIGTRALKRFQSYVILGEGKKLQSIVILGKAMNKYTEALEMNGELEFEVKALQYQAGIQLAGLANKADEFEEIQMAIHSLERAREFAGGIGNRNEQLIIDLRSKLSDLDKHKARIGINERMEEARAIQAVARSPRLKIGMTVPQIQELLGEPHEKISRKNDIDHAEELWIYYVKDGTLQLSFQDYQLFKIEEI